MSEQKPSHEVEEIVRKAPTQDCVEAQIWGRVPTHFSSIEGPQEHTHTQKMMISNTNGQEKQLVTITLLSCESKPPHPDVSKAEKRPPMIV